MRILLTILLLALAHSANAADIHTINTTAQDPTVLCSVLRNKLPNTISGMHKLSRLHSSSISPDTYFCEEQKSNCSIHHLKFTGLELEVLEDKNVSDIFIINVQIADSKWRLFGDIAVGQKLDLLEERFGVKIPRDISPVVLNGECTPLTIWHNNGTLVKLELNCDSCL